MMREVSQADRGGAQHRPGDQGDHLHLARGRARSSALAVQPRRGRRRRAAGRAGQGGAHPPLAAAGHRGPDHPALRSERLADHVDRAAVEGAADPRAHRPRRRGRADAHRGDPRRRRREHRRRQRAPDPRAGGSGRACAPTASRRRRSRRRCQRENQEVPAGRIERGASGAAGARHRPHRRPERVRATSRSPCATARRCASATSPRWSTARKSRRSGGRDQRHVRPSRSRCSRSPAPTRWRWPTRCAPRWRELEKQLPARRPA